MEECKNIQLDTIIKEIDGIKFIVEREISCKANETLHEKFKRMILQDAELAILRQ